MPKYEQSTTVEWSIACCETCGKLTTGPQQRVHLQFKLHKKVCKGKLQLSQEVRNELMRIRLEGVAHEPTKVIHESRSVEH